MLDSIKTTLVRLLGPESAQVVEFYVDKKLALEDPAAFEQALTDFLGSQGGRLLIEAIKSDIRSGAGRSRIRGRVSKFVNGRPKLRQAPNVSLSRTLKLPTQTEPKREADPRRVRFVHAVNQMMENGTTLRNLVTEYLVESVGPTCAYATLACMGRRALENPEAFAEKAGSRFGLEGETLLASLTQLCETRLRGRQLAVP